MPDIDDWWCVEPQASSLCQVDHTPTVWQSVTGMWHVHILLSMYMSRYDKLYPVAFASQGTKAEHECFLYDYNSATKKFSSSSFLLESSTIKQVTDLKTLIGPTLRNRTTIVLKCYH
jgi:hypothetical protein